MYNNIQEQKLYSLFKLNLESVHKSIREIDSILLFLESQMKYGYSVDNKSFKNLHIIKKDIQSMLQTNDKLILEVTENLKKYI